MRCAINGFLLEQNVTLPHISSFGDDCPGPLCRQRPRSRVQCRAAPLRPCCAAKVRQGFTILQRGSGHGPPSSPNAFSPTSPLTQLPRRSTSSPSTWTPLRKLKRSFIHQVPAPRRDTPHCPLLVIASYHRPQSYPTSSARPASSPVFSAPPTAPRSPPPPLLPPTPGPLDPCCALCTDSLTSAYFMFPLTGTPADPKPVLVSASISGSGAKVAPLDVANATALIYLRSLAKLVLITQVCAGIAAVKLAISAQAASNSQQDDVLTVDPSTGALTPNHIPFPGPDFLNTGVATTDGSNIFLLFGQDPTQTSTPDWFIGVISMEGATVVKGTSHSAAKYTLLPHLSALPTHPLHALFCATLTKRNNLLHVPHRYSLERPCQWNYDPERPDEFSRWRKWYSSRQPQSLQQQRVGRNVRVSCRRRFVGFSSATAAAAYLFPAGMTAITSPTRSPLAGCLKARRLLCRSR
jgi:hypothetical protein